MASDLARVVESGMIKRVVDRLGKIDFDSVGAAEFQAKLTREVKRIAAAIKAVEDESRQT